MPDQIAFYHLLKYCIKDNYERKCDFEFMIDLLCSVYSHIRTKERAIVWVCNICVLLNYRSIGKFNINLNNKIFKCIRKHEIEMLGTFFIEGIYNYRNNFQCVFNNELLTQEYVQYFKDYILSEMFIYEKIFLKLIDDVENLRNVSIQCDGNTQCIIDSGCKVRENDLQICYNDVCLKNDFAVKEYVENYIQQHDKYELSKQFYTVDLNPHTQKYEIYQFNTLETLNSIVSGNNINPFTGVEFSEKTMNMITTRFRKEMLMLKHFY